MPAEKGSAFLLKVGNGGEPPVFATVAGMRTTQLSVNGEAVNVTNKDSGGWRELLSGAGLGRPAPIPTCLMARRAWWVFERLLLDQPAPIGLVCLSRGWTGTERASAHQPGEPFALIEADRVAAIDPPVGSLGGEVRLLAQGIGDEQGTSASRILTGEAMRPPSPVHLRAVRLASGEIEIGWVRRSRSGWHWPGGSATPLGEESELYRVRFSAETFDRSFTVKEPSLLYGLAEQSADGFEGAMRIEVVQIGTFASSRPVVLNFSEES